MPKGLLCELNGKMNKRHSIYTKLSKTINNIFKSMNCKAKDKHYLLYNSVQKKAFGSCAVIC